MVKTSADGLFFSAGQAFVTRVPSRPELSQQAEAPEKMVAMLREDAHSDGSAGMLHIGLTLGGRRLLKIWSEGRRPMAIAQQPGSFYITCSTAFKHQAIHISCPEEELYQFGNIDGCSISVMMRSAFFPFDRSRDGNCTPSPQSAFQAFASVISGWLVKHGCDLCLPTVPELEAGLLALKSSEVTASSSKRRRSARGSISSMPS